MIKLLSNFIFIYAKSFKKFKNILFYNIFLIISMI